MTFRPLAIAAVALLTSAGGADAQRRAVTVDAFAGAARYGRFLEQRPFGRPVGQQVELTGSGGLALGASLAVEAYDATALRLGFTYTGSELEYQDDTPGGSGAEHSELQEFRTYTASAELVKHVGNARWRIRPYGLAGVTGTWWNLDGGDEIVLPDARIGATEQDGLFRFGGIGGIGLQVRATRAIGIRLEAARIESGSPFDGDDAWRSSLGETIDEPDRVGVTRLVAGLSWTFGGRTCCPKRRTRGRR